jgi:anaerobic selenocysteine-containing dehydrogenase
MPALLEENMSAAVEPKIVRSACPLDCPDACTLDVTIEEGRVTKITGNTINPVTDGYICRKVRHFPDLMYGPDRLLHPMIRTGPKGEGKFQQATWDEALNLIAERFGEIRRDHGGEAILPLCYGGSNGYLTQDAMDGRFFRRLGASRILRTVCAAPTGRASRGLYGGMPGVAIPDYALAQCIILWGVNPAASGIHLAPFIKEARSKGAKLIVVDPVRTPFASQADVHLAVKPGTDVAVALAMIHWLFENKKADLDFLELHAEGWEELQRRSAEWSIVRAASVAEISADDLEAAIQFYADAEPAVIRCGWGVERNRNGGSAVCAILALPAVAGKFGHQGGGYTMSNTPAWDLTGAFAAQEPEKNTRSVNMNQYGKALLEETDPRIMATFIYNCNPMSTLPHQNLVRQGLLRDDLFTVVFEQVNTDTCRYADVLLPATTFLEHRELVRGYGSLILNSYAAAAEPAGEAKSNTEVFGELVKRMNLAKPDDVFDDREMARMILNSSRDREALMSAVGERDGSTVPDCGPNPVQFATVFPKTPSGKIELVPDALDDEAPIGLYRFQPEADSEGLTLISPASAKTISSTLAQIWKEPAEVRLHPDDAEARGLADGDSVRVYNAIGETHVLLKLDDDVRPGVAVIHKGYWARHTLNGSTANALAPDSLTDLGGGACFNDTRVEIAKLNRRDAE